MKKFLALIAILTIGLLTADRPVDVELQSSNTFKYDATLHLLCGGNSNGTGTVVDAHTVYTAAHVVGKNKTCKVISGGPDVTLAVKDIDASNDLATLYSRKAFKETYEIDCNPIVSDETYNIAGYAYGQSLVDRDAVGVPTYYNNKDNGQRLRGMVSDTVSGMSGGPAIDPKGRARGILIGRVNFPPNHAVVQEFHDTSVCSTLR